MGVLVRGFNFASIRESLDHSLSSLGVHLRNGRSTQKFIDTPRQKAVLPQARGARASTHSVLLLHNSYYHYFYLAQALRRRGWDALSLSLEDPNNSNAFFYHGEDINLFDSDPAVFEDRIKALEVEIQSRFKMIQFSGDGQMSIYPSNFDYDKRRTMLPADFLRFKQLGIKIGYTSGGCADGIMQSSFREWSGGMCDKCTLQDKPDFCSDFRNLAWGHKREMFCDLNAAETLPALDYQFSESAFREPLTMCVHSEIWSPDIEIPPEFKLEKKPNELLIYHGVGNYRDSHYSGNRDVKGTQAILAAVDRLKSEGRNIQFVFIDKVQSKYVRYYQAQADVVVDQLNTGRYGANARESMMLGKPVVGNLQVAEANGVSELRSLNECPIVNATESSIYDVLKGLESDRTQLSRLGRASRDYALRWHSADACAERFEAVYDGLMSGNSPQKTETSLYQGASV